MNPARLAEIRQRLEAATPRPWRLAIACDEHGEDESLAVVRAGYADIATATNANAAFIANAPDDIADLLAEVERLTGVVEALEVSAHKRWADDLDADNWRCR